MGETLGKSSAPEWGSCICLLSTFPSLAVGQAAPRAAFSPLAPPPASLGCASSGFSSHRMIYKCAMCDTVFTHKPLLSSHFDQHLLNQRVSVFKCPDCPLLFAQKRTMLEHLKVMDNPLVLSDEGSPSPGAAGAGLGPSVPY